MPLIIFCAECAIPLWKGGNAQPLTCPNCGTDTTEEDNTAIGAFDQDEFAKLASHIPVTE